MTTMSDEGERLCPLCTEEMDLTDQQLKPCKCGYEICVWCWHHIIDMAEKDDTEGRCPACRAPYDKERIVGAADGCERMRAEMNADRRQKSQKAKPKMSAEARKHLSSVRVIQRNLVYIIGLPSNLADENMLERREYFGLYGKVLKVSISRPAGGAQQTSASNTFNVYITYAKEEEAVRCIQAVHNFVLEGRPLRACFGTTKYCHAWLRNMTCSNPDCLYLHDVGCQADSFTKDEIISAYTRSRVPQTALNNLQRRSGNVLPPPTDDFLLSGTSFTNKLVVKNPSNNLISQGKDSSANATAAVGAAGRSAVLPAAASWGLRSNCRPPVSSSTSMQGSAKQKTEIPSNSSFVVASTKQTSAWHDAIVSTQKTTEESWVTHLDGRHRPLESCKSIDSDSQTGLTNSVEVGDVKLTSAWYDDDITSSKIPAESHVLDGRSRPSESFKSHDRDTLSAVSNSSGEIVHAKETSAWYDDEVTTSEISQDSHVGHLRVRSGPLEPPKSCIGRDFQTTISNITHTKQTSAWDDDVITTPEISEEFYSFHSNDVPRPLEASKTYSGKDSRTSVSDLSANIILDTAHTSVTSTYCSSSLVAGEGEDNDRTLSEETKVPANKLHSEEFNLLSCGLASDKVNSTSTASNGNIQNLCSDLSLLNVDNEVSPLTGKGTGDIFAAEKQRLRSSNITTQSYLPSQSHHPSDPLSNHSWNGDFGSTGLSVNGRDSRILGGLADETLHPFRDDNIICSEHAKRNYSSLDNMRKVLEHPDKIVSGEETKGMGILNQLSCVDKTTSVDVGENNIISNILSMDFDPWDHSLISANNFAKLLSETDRQNGSLGISNSWKTQNNNQSRFSFARQEGQPIGHVQRNSSISHGSFGAGLQNGFTIRGVENPSTFVNSNHSVISPEKTAAVSRAKVSAPPGFLVPNRAPPPGFSSQNRLDHAYDTTLSESVLLGNSSLRDRYQAPLTGNAGDVEFIDPAILAVGKGRLPLGLGDSGLGLRSSFPTQFDTSEGDPRFQLLMQQSISAHHDMRILDHSGDRFLSGSYIPSRLPAQNHSSLSPFAQMPLQTPRNTRVSSNQWDGWNDVQTGSDMGMTQILRNERLGLNKYFPGNEEIMFHMPSSGDLYNRAFGM